MTTPHPPIIALLTDFGLADSYVGEMHAVIAAIAPAARVIDLSHDLPPQDLVAAAVLLADTVDTFPAGSIFTAVVDPGVGSDRRAVAVATERYHFVAPDNGLLTLVLQTHRARSAVVLDNSAMHFHARGGSHTFHGRDIFSPAAAHLTNHVPISRLGSAVALEKLVRLQMPEPVRRDGRLMGQVLRVDHFGNVITSVRRAHLTDTSGDQVVVAGRRVGPLRRTFSDVKPGEAVAYIGSHGRLEIAVRNGHAARQLQVRAGDDVELV